MRLRGDTTASGKHLYHCCKPVLALAVGAILSLLQHRTVNAFLSPTVVSKREDNHNLLSTIWTQTWRKTTSFGMSPSSYVQIPPPYHHHSAIKTRNITTAIDFYSLFGYQVLAKFRTGPARAAWLGFSQDTNDNNYASSKSGCRLELIEVPDHILKEEPGKRKRAIDLMNHEDLLGYNHIALDVTEQVNRHSMTTLEEWIEHLNQQSVQMFGKTLRIALKPKQQLIGRYVYELAFLYDADGCLLELLYLQRILPQQVDSGWVPWSGTDFVGKEDA